MRARQRDGLDVIAGHVRQRRDGSVAVVLDAQVDFRVGRLHLPGDAAPQIQLPRRRPDQGENVRLLPRRGAAEVDALLAGGGAEVVGRGVERGQAVGVDDPAPRPRLDDPLPRLGQRQVLPDQPVRQARQPLVAELLPPPRHLRRPLGPAAPSRRRPATPRRPPPRSAARSPARPRTRRRRAPRPPAARQLVRSAKSSCRSIGPDSPLVKNYFVRRANLIARRRAGGFGRGAMPRPLSWTAPRGPRPA